MSNGQSITDRVVAAKHTVTGQSLAKVVCKATTEEIMSPKRKHLDYLLHCTNEPNVSIPHLADLLIERTQNSNWVVVFKSLVTVHNLMNYGNERFSQYLASSNCKFNLDSFYDRGGGMQGYSMSTYIRSYAKYLNRKAYSYRQMAMDFCRTKKGEGKEDGSLRSMNTEQLIKALPILQSQFDALIEFDANAGQLTNGIITTAFLLLFKDLIRLYACYNGGIINLLEKYFDMNKKNCRESFDIYKSFLVRIDKVGGFFKVAEHVGVDKGDIPDLAKAPASLLEALEQHLTSLENTKKTTVVSKNDGASPTVKSAAAAATTTSASGPTSSSAMTILEEEKKRILEEEERMLNLIKQQNMKSSTIENASTPAPKSTNSPMSTFPKQPSAETAVVTPLRQAQASTKLPTGNEFDLPPLRPSDDLLMLASDSAFRSPSSFGAASNGFNSSFPSAFPMDNNPFLTSRAATTAPPVDLFGANSFAGFDQYDGVRMSLAPRAPMAPMGAVPMASMGSTPMAHMAPMGAPPMAHMAPMGAPPMAHMAPMGAAPMAHMAPMGAAPMAHHMAPMGAAPMAPMVPIGAGHSPLMAVRNGNSSNKHQTSDNNNFGIFDDVSGSHAFGGGGANDNTVSASKTTPGQPTKLITRDIDDSLSKIAGNLGIRTAEQFKRPEHQWSGSNEKRMTGAGGGGPSWNQPAPPSPSMYHMVQPRPVAMVGVTPTMVMMTSSQYPGMMAQPSYTLATGQPMMMNPGVPMNLTPSHAIYGSPVPAPSSQPHQQQPFQKPVEPNDPFGAL